MKGTTKVFGEVVKLAETTAKAGAVLCQAPADGVAVITCKDPIVADPKRPSFAVFGESPNFTVVQFCHKGEAITVPAGWNWAPPRDGDGNIPNYYSFDNNSDRTFGVYFYKFLD